MKVPEEISINSIPKELLRVFSKEKTDPGENTMLKTVMTVRQMFETFFDIIGILFIATPSIIYKDLINRL